MLSSERRLKTRIAVVDDERMILKVFSSLLRRSDYEVDFFSDPRKALDAVVADPGRYDLVISDVRMPGMDGITFAKRIRYLLPNLPFVFMTAYLSDELKEQISSLGNTRLLEKPFPLEAVLKEIIPKFLIMNH